MCEIKKNLFFFEVFRENLLKTLLIGLETTRKKYRIVFEKFLKYMIFFDFRCPSIHHPPPSTIRQNQFFFRSAFPVRSQYVRSAFAVRSQCVRSAFALKPSVNTSWLSPGTPEGWNTGAAYWEKSFSDSKYSTCKTRHSTCKTRHSTCKTRYSTCKTRVLFLFFFFLFSFLIFFFLSFFFFFLFSFFFFLSFFLIFLIFFVSFSFSFSCSCSSSCSFFLFLFSLSFFFFLFSVLLVGVLCPRRAWRLQPRGGPPPKKAY